MASFGVEGIRYFNHARAAGVSTAGDLTYTFNRANGIDSKLRSRGHTRAFYWANTNCWETDIRDTDKGGLVPMARRLTDMGFSIMATRGTASRIRDAGLPVRVVNKVLEGRPHCVDSIQSGEVQLVINTAGSPQSVTDSFDIRRSALTHGVPHYTTIAGARAAVHAIAALKAGTLEVAPLQSYFRELF